MLTWAAQYNNWLLNALTPKGVVFSFLFFSFLFFSFLFFSFLFFSFLFFSCSFLLHHVAGQNPTLRVRCPLIHCTLLHIIDLIVQCIIHWMYIID